jgi:hypothetical protein
MTKKYEVINIRFSEEHEEIVDRIGDYLHKQGIFGLRRQGKINRSAVIKYLIEREYQSMLESEKRLKASETQ